MNWELFKLFQIMGISYFFVYLLQLFYDYNLDIKLGYMIRRFLFNVGQG